jgi:hypothetical protein
MGTLLRALLEGFGWHVGREAAREALDHVEKALPPEPSPPPPLDPKALEAERKARAKADAAAARERAAAKQREEKAIDADLRALKKRIQR